MSELAIARPPIGLGASMPLKVSPSENNRIILCYKVSRDNDILNVMIYPQTLR